jgi:hypothetical protein
MRHISACDVPTGQNTDRATRISSRVNWKSKLIGGTEVKLHALTSALKWGGSGHITPCLQSLRHLMDPEAGLDIAVAKRKIPAPTGNRIPDTHYFPESVGGGQ